MREGLKTLIVACVVLLLAGGIAACGGDDGSDSTGAEAGGQVQPEGKGGGGSRSDDARDGDETEASDGSGGGDAADFVPREHQDSGGGSAPLKVKGGDNSVQEFGEEADASEFDAAAAALHGFLDARAEGNWAAACEYMSGDMIESFEKLAAQAKRLKGSDCAAILETLVNPAAAPALRAEARRADVRSLRTEGEQAFAIYTGTEGSVVAMPMVDENGEWKVGSLSGTPLN